MEKEKKSLDEEAVLLLNRGKRGFFRLVFGRTRSSCCWPPSLSSSLWLSTA